MPTYIALLRAINVGGRKLIMNELADIAKSLGFVACTMVPHAAQARCEWTLVRVAQAGLHWQRSVFF